MGYSKLSVPKQLMERLEGIVEEHPELGYRNPSEAAIDAIRRRVEDLEERRGRWRRRVEDDAKTE